MRAGSTPAASIASRCGVSVWLPGLRDANVADEHRGNQPTVFLAFMTDQSRNGRQEAQVPDLFVRNCGDDIGVPNPTIIAVSVTPGTSSALNKSN